MSKRCQWAGMALEIYTHYHDTEWGVPVYDDQKIFEFLVLESFQAGLSWLIILKKREGFRNAFAGFNPAEVARFTDADVGRLMQDKSIVRNRAKILATINNAQRFIEVQKELGSFSKYMWSFVGGRPQINTWQEMSQLPATSPVSDAWSKDLKKRGFKFLGSTICYSHMQAIGMVNDHTIDCFRYEEIQRMMK